MKKVWHDYGLSITLAALFLFSWGAQAYFQWQHFVSEQQAHKQPIEMQEYINDFGQATMENWQSEFLQLLTFVVLTTYLYHKGSHESKDSDEKVERKLDKIERMLASKTSKR